MRGNVIYILVCVAFLADTKLGSHKKHSNPADKLDREDISSSIFRSAVLHLQVEVIFRGEVGGASKLSVH